MNRFLFVVTGLVTLSQAAVLHAQSAVEKGDLATVSTLTSPAVPPCAVTIAAGASIQSAINSHAAGTVFCLAAGTWHQQTITHIASNDKFIGSTSGNTILTGDDTTTTLYSNAESTGVLWENITVEHYNKSTSGCSLGAIHGPVDWTFVNDTFTYNNCTGLVTGSGDTVSGGHYTYNLHAGIEASNNTAPIVIEGAEIAYNNTREDDPTNDASGLKFAKVTNVQLLNNYVHNNHSNGLWLDIGSSNVVVDGNTVINNAYEGIRYEISTGPSYIRNNTVNNNGGGAPSGYSDDQIGLYSSDHVQVYGNNVQSTGNEDGIVVQADVRSDAPYATTEDDQIFNNTITFTSSSSSAAHGFRDYGGPTGNDGVASIIFNANSLFVVSTGDKHWVWNSTTQPTTWASYRSLSGQDSTSVLSAGNGAIATSPSTAEGSMSAEGGVL